MGWLIFIIIVTVVIVFAVTAIVTDRIILSSRLKKIEVGMTGQGVMKATKLPVKIISANRETGSFVGVIRSPLKIYKYKLYFDHGKYSRKERLTK